MLGWLEPWEFSWLFLAVFVATALLYVRGVRRRATPRSRQCVFWLGMGLTYVSMHTMVDYYAEHQFFVHRLQQTVLHHLAPLLLMASAPLTVLRAGLPLRCRRWWRMHRSDRLARIAAWLLGSPTLVTLLFVLLLLFWLVPHIQMIGMLDWRLYRLMNWSMLLGGVLYWRLILDRRPCPPARMWAGMRVLSPALTMTPQILAGAIITFTRHDIYPVFDMCGRIFTNVDVMSDQQWGGLITWIPAAFVESAGAMLALNHWMRLSRRGSRVAAHARLEAAAALALRGSPQASV
jgi:putative membrane protein